MNSKEIGFLNVLARRRDWLSDRIAKGHVLSFDRRERAALNWAIDIINGHFDRQERQAEAETALLDQCTTEERRVLLSGGVLREGPLGLKRLP